MKEKTLNKFPQAIQQKAFVEFIKSGQSANDQITFVNSIIDFLTKSGLLKAPYFLILSSPI